MARNALQAHARDKLGISDALSARPVQAALASAASFAVGAAVPLLMVSLSPRRVLGSFVTIVSLLCLAILGSVASKVGGAAILEGAVRVMFWGCISHGCHFRCRSPLWDDTSVSLSAMGILIEPPIPLSLKCPYTQVCSPETIRCPCADFVLGASRRAYSS